MQLFIDLINEKYEYNYKTQQNLTRFATILVHFSLILVHFSLILAHILQNFSALFPAYFRYF